MEAKYYTPAFEEFHIGFEFETNYLKKENEWTKVVMQPQDSGSFFERYISDASPLEFRVKHLDQQDIESLGWNKRTFQSKEYHTRDFYLVDCGENYFLLHSGEEGDISYNRLFTGTIKNKSELKRLMIQTGVLENN